MRGFCHVYTGQEAVVCGIESAITFEDDFIQSYRCHAHQLMRGDTVRRIAAEMYGLYEGSSKGKGGSMHMFVPENNFWGG